MTLGISWVREVGKTRELIVISDSRITGGGDWDANPKIMLLPRSDCVISFAGFTSDAYSLMLQVFNTIEMFAPAKNRSLDLAELKGHLLRVINHSRTFITSPTKGLNDPPDPKPIFILAGYSWREKEFKIWKLHFDSRIEKFTFRHTRKWKGQKDGSNKTIAFIGDENVILEAKEKLVNILKKKRKIKTGSLNMEPFTVLTEIIREKKFPSIGGSPQIVKIYEHMNVAPMGVYWPKKSSKKISLLGRPLMDYEKCPWGIIDPDNPTETESLKDLIEKTF